MLAAGLSRAAQRGWSSGVSGEGATDGAFGAWRGSQVGVVGTWADTDAQAQQAASVRDFASWSGDLDIAVGGTAVNSSETYAQAAAGAFDSRWTTMAKNIQAARGNAQGATYVRPWHEFNGHWYSNWQVTPANVEDYKTAWRRMAGILRKECPSCVMVWSPNDGSSDGSASIDSAYPGHDVVDVISIDSYNANGNPVVTSAEKWTEYATATEPDGSPHGVETWRQWAAKHGKPIAFSEWGLRKDSGGGDNPEYIQHMHDWMTEHAAQPGDTNLAGKVIYDVYFNFRHEGRDDFLIKDGPNQVAGRTYQSLRWGAQTTYTATSPSTASSTTAAAPTGQGPLTAGQVTLTAPGVTRDAETLTDRPYVDGGTPRQQLDLYLPKRTGTAVPLVVFIHGGAFSGGDKADVATFSQAFLAKGYAVASVNYRLSGDAPFPAGAQDVKAAVRWLRAHAAEHGLDPSRFGALGTSAGGYLAAMLGVTVSQQPSALDDPALGNADVSSAVQAVASLYGPTNFTSMNTHAKQSQCSGTPQDHDAAGSPESVWLGSPVQTSSLAAAANLTHWIPAAKPGSIPPFLLIHGTADCLVPSGQSEELAAALRPAGIRVDVDLVTGASHGGSAIDVDKQSEFVAFFDRELAVGSQSSSAAPSATVSPSTQTSLHATQPPVKGAGS